MLASAGAVPQFSNMQPVDQAFIYNLYQHGNYYSDLWPAFRVVLKK